MSQPLSAQSMKLVFLHALPFDGRMWGANTEHTALNTLAPNLFTLGDSIEEWAAAVLDLAGSDELIVVGCSVGGSAALELARAAPDQVAALVLIGAKAGVRPEPLTRDTAIRVLETEGMNGAWSRYWAPLFSDQTSAAVKQTARDQAMSQDVELIVNGVRAFHNRRDLSAVAAAWTKPLTGISGADDTAPPPSKLRRLASGPNRSFHLVPRCGHYVSLEQPAIFDELLARAISGSQAPSG